MNAKKLLSEFVFLICTASLGWLAAEYVLCGVPIQYRQACNVGLAVMLVLVAIAKLAKPSLVWDMVFAPTALLFSGAWFIFHPERVAKAHQWVEEHGSLFNLHEAAFEKSLFTLALGTLLMAFGILTNWIRNANVTGYKRKGIIAMLSPHITLTVAIVTQVYLIFTAYGGKKFQSPSFGQMTELATQVIHQATLKAPEILKPLEAESDAPAISVPTLKRTAETIVVGNRNDAKRASKTQKPREKKANVKEHKTRKSETHPPITAKNSDSVGPDFDVRHIHEVTAEDINSIFSKRGVLSDSGQLFIDAGKKYGIDPIFCAAIAAHEGARGTSAPAMGKLHNPVGEFKPDASGSRAFGSIEEAIFYNAAHLAHSKHFVAGGKHTVAQIKLEYCPDGAKNDAKGQNPDWLPGVLYYMNKICKKAEQRLNAEHQKLTYN